MSEAYDRDQIFVAYIKWHYGKGIKEYFGVVSNFLWFVLHFFSFKLLFRTLFSPWKRLGESYDGTFNLGAIASTLVVNTLMRFIGFVTRSAIMFIGIVSYLVVILIGFTVFIIWLFAPIVLLGCLVLAVTFFII
jgi:hypothetical protein